MQYANIWCLALRTPHEADFAVLFLPDARASAPSMLLASGLFILDIESTLIPFLQHDYSSVILYFINNDSSCDSEGAVEYNKRSRVWQMLDYGRKRCSEKYVGTVLTYTVPWIFWYMPVPEPNHVSFSFSLTLLSFKLFCIKLWMLRKKQKTSALLLLTVFFSFSYLFHRLWKYFIWNFRPDRLAVASKPVRARLQKHAGAKLSDDARSQANGGAPVLATLCWCWK